MCLLTSMTNINVSIRSYDGARALTGAKSKIVLPAPEHEN